MNKFVYIAYNFKNINIVAEIKLKVLGISQSSSQTGAFALVLSNEEDSKRIPIIIGGFEAQAIAIILEGLNAPRPLTHDLFINFITAFNIEISKISIHKLEEGVFHSQIHSNNGAASITHDARTSDAIALALRVGADIYTTEEILETAGIDSVETDGTDNTQNTTIEENVPSGYAGKSLTDLNELLKNAISNEDYEKASEIRDEINARQ